MLVSEILAIKGKVLFTIAPNRSIAEAVEIMNEQDVGSLVVFSRGAMVGMLTFRQVLQAVQKGGADWQALTVNEVMLRDPLAASPNMEMDELRRLMVEHHQRYRVTLAVSPLELGLEHRIQPPAVAEPSQAVGQCQ